MPIMFQNQLLETSVVSRLETDQRIVTPKKTDKQAHEFYSTETETDFANPIDIMRNLQSLINQKDFQIRHLTEALQVTNIKLAIKNLKAQQKDSLTEKLTKQNLHIKQQNFTLRKKLALFVQINERQFQEINNLEKEKNSLVEKISQFENELKAQVAVREMKSAELRLEVTDEKRRNGKLEKEIDILRAVIKELQEDEDDDTGDEFQRQECCSCLDKAKQNAQKQNKQHHGHSPQDNCKFGSQSVCLFEWDHITSQKQFSLFGSEQASDEQIVFM